MAACDFATTTDGTGVCENITGSTSICQVVTAKSCLCPTEVTLDAATDFCYKNASGILAQIVDCTDNSVATALCFCGAGNTITEIGDHCTDTGNVVVKKCVENTECMSTSEADNVCKVAENKTCMCNADILTPG